MKPELEQVLWPVERRLNMTWMKRERTAGKKIQRRQDVERLKLLLDLFSTATGLKINYDKSTAVPMHIPDRDLPACLQVLGCRQEGFPQTYLGLPLSCSKLKLAAFDPYICKADRAPCRLASLAPQSHGEDSVDQRSS
jgi:hypothetical protein